MKHHECLTELAPGKIYMDYGPISMVLAAWQGPKPLTGLCRAATDVAVLALAQISEQLPSLKQPWPLCREGWNPIAQEMWDSVRMTGEPDLTPMAAVAGTIADTAADWLFSQGATKVFVNNGGDIAVRLAHEETLRVGVVPRLGTNEYSYTIQLTGGDNIGGIATSGCGGRSFTQGIADAVTVLAKRCSVADAYATALANASFVDAPQVKRVPAKELDPDTDIPDTLVTVEVGPIASAVARQSLEQVLQKAKAAWQYSQIAGVAVHVQGESGVYPDALFRALNGRYFPTK